MKLRTRILNLGDGFAVVFEVESSQGRVVFIAGAAVGRPAKWWGRPTPYHGQMASPSSRCFFTSWLSKVSAPFGGNALWIVQSGDGGGNGGDGGDRSDGWWLSVSHVFVFLPYTYVHICNAKIFYKTMKCKKMNEWYF